MSLQPAVSRVLGRYGRPFTLWKQAQAAGAQPWKPGAVTEGFHTCTARQRRVDPRKLAGTVSENLGLIVVDASTLAVPPVKGDKIAPGEHVANAPGVEWYQVGAVDRPMAGDRLPVYRLEVSR